MIKMNLKGLNSLKFVSFLVTPILIAIFPTLSFYVNNIADLAPIFLKDTLIYSIIASIALTLSLYAITKNRQRSAVITSIAIFIFFSYGHFSKFLNDKLFIQLPNKTILGPDKIFLPLVLLIFVFLVLRVVQSKKNFVKLMIYINISLLILIGYSTLTIVKTEYISNTTGTLQLETSQNNKRVIQESPDIYHIVLDGYARSDVLKKFYDYDNSYFIDSLKKMGFYVADKSHSNYLHTHLSLSSTFNMTYLDFLPEKYGSNAPSQSAAIDLIHKNLVAQKLKNINYTTINFNSGWAGTNENYIADINHNDSKTFKFAGLNLITNETYMMFLQTTLLFPLIQELSGDIKRERIVSTLEKLPDIPYKNGKKFTLAHIIAPHPPYFFTADGDPIPSSEIESEDGGFVRKDKYIDQLTFISNQILPIIQKLIKNSSKPPIIILQSDHGPASILGRLEDWDKNYSQDGIDERSGNLYAIYFPEHDYTSLYQNITPVNTYRIIFNKYFAENLELLPDKTYYTGHDQIYNFVDVTN